MPKPLVRPDETTTIAGSTWHLPVLPATAGAECLFVLLGWMGYSLESCAALVGGFFGAAPPPTPAPDPEDPGEEPSALDAPAEGETERPAEAVTSSDPEARERAAKALTLAVASVLQRMDSPRTVKWIRTLFTGLHKDKSPVNFDREFAGNYGTMFAVLAWAVRVNFGSFFVANPLIDLLKARAGTRGLGALFNGRPQT